MSGRKVVLAVALIGVMLLAGLNVAVSTAPRTAAPSSTAAVAAAPSNAVVAGSAQTTSSGSLGISASRLATVEADKASLLASGGNLSTFLPPNLHQAPPLSRTGGHVTPLYSVAPAPMGVAYYGLNNTSGSIESTIANTTSLQGFFTTSDTLGVQTEEFDFGTQTAYGSQLNAVLTNVTIHGQNGFGPNINAPSGCSGYFSGAESNWCPNQFWLQNVINYNTVTHSLTFENNIWNFSNPTAAWATTNGVTLRGGSNPSGGYYAVSGPSITISYPFTVVLYLNTTVGKCVVGGTGVVGAASCANIQTTGPVNQVFFNYTVYNSLGHVVCPTTERTRQVCGEYDDVFFNSISPTVNPSGVSFGSAQITADGQQYDPLGLTNDWEMDWGIGTSSGATTVVYYADATVGINYCPAAKTNTHTGKCSAYAAPPAAYDYGGETGETNIGAVGYWSTESAGAPNPSYLTGNGQPVAHFVNGPSLLIGLWNTSTPTGTYALNYHAITPANAWVGIAPGAGVTNQSKFQVASTFGWFSARSGSGGSKKATTNGANLYLPPGMYTVEVLLSGYDPSIQTVDLRSSSAAPTIALTPDATTGVYTPMWAYSSSDLANLSVSGAGTAGHPYVMVSGTGTVGAPYGETGSLSWLFSNLNDYLFTLWIGAYLNSTTAYVAFNHAAEFLIDYPTWQWGALAQFDVPRYDGLQYYLFHAQNVTVANATNLYTWANSEATSVTTAVCNVCLNDLFANDRFNVSDIGISFTGSTGALAHNTLAHVRNMLWGNTFVASSQPTYTGLIAPSRFVTESDSFDRIYNNAFDANLTISETSTTNINYWNVTCQAGYAPLSSGYYPGPTVCQPASYSQSMNGYALSGSILGTAYQGGNYWFNYGGYANPYANLPYVGRTTAYNSGGIGQPSGKHAGDFAPLIGLRVYKVPFTESGLASSTSTTAFTMVLKGTHNNKNSSATSAVPAGCSVSVCVNFYEPNGSYTFTASSSLSGISANPASGTFSVAGAALGATNINFGTGYAVTFTESGLPNGVTWYANVSGQSSKSTTTSGGGGTTLSVTVPNGVYSYRIASANKVWAPSYSSPFTVSGATLGVPVSFSELTYTATFTESGLPGGTAWWVNVSGQPSQMGTGTQLSLALPNGSYTYTVASADKQYSASGGGFAVAGSGPSVLVTFSQVTYAVSVSESGLPGGTLWYVNVSGGGSFSSTGTTIAFAEPNGSYTFTVATTDKTYSASGGSFSIAGAGASASVTFAAVTFSAEFDESGLPGGTTWYVNISGGPSLSGSSSSLETSLTNGSYTFTVATADKQYSAVGGGFSISGAGVVEPVTFGLEVFGVTFAQSGLPGGTSWYVNITATASLTSMGSSASVNLPNGSYTYTVASADKHYSAPGGAFEVAGSMQTVDVTFSSVTFSVTFSESGLPLGTEWFVNTTGETPLSGTTSLLGPLALVNGTYSYHVATVNKVYSAHGGMVTVSGASRVVSVTFAKESYTLSFTESGLPAKKLAKAGWTVVLNGTSAHATTATISFPAVANGTYPVLVTGPSGYQASGSGTVHVHGATTVSVTMSKGKTVTLTFAEKGLVKGTSWCATVDASTVCSTKASIKFADLVPGTYSYGIGSIAGKTATAKVGKNSVALSGSITLAKSTKVAVKYVASGGGGVPARGPVASVEGAVLARPETALAAPALVVLEATVLGLLGAAWALVSARRRGEDPR
ncbi:MAG TPA: thermopsin family protease [Thermoplasmata archaeon]|nr:thermopsin family protease [Thermoplasmata archaeon]